MTECGTVSRDKILISLDGSPFSREVLPYVKRFLDPAREIIDFVDEEDVDLIAMTTHGRSSLSRLLFGSVAEEVIRHVSVPVMMLRPSPVADAEQKE